MDSGRRYTRLPAGLWSDARFLRLPPEAQLCYLNTRSGAQSHSSGLLRLRPLDLGYELGWEAGRLSEALGELERAGLVRFAALAVYLPDMVRDYPPENPNVLVGWVRHADLIPEPTLRAEWAREVACATSWTHPMLTGWASEDNPALAPFFSRGERVQAPPVQAPRLPPAAVQMALVETERAKRGPPDDSIREAVAGWSVETGHALKGEASKTLARARLREGFTVADLRLIAAWGARGPRAAFFGGANDRQTVYLRPETLWGAQKAAGYLQAAKEWVERAPGGAFGTSVREEDARERAMAETLALASKNATPEPAPAPARHEDEVEVSWGDTK